MDALIFDKLTQQELREIAPTAESMRRYIRMLTVMHDLTCEFSSSPVHARLQPMDQEREVQQLRQVLEASRQAASDASPWLRLQRSLRHAQMIHEQLRDERETTPQQRRVVDAFIDDLLAAYREAVDGLSEPAIA